jgi:hypothetical protein
VVESVGRAVDVPFDGGDHTVSVLVDAIHLRGVGVEEAHGKIDTRLERGEPLVDVQVDFVGEAARNEPVAELALVVLTRHRAPGERQAFGRPA